MNKHNYFVKFLKKVNLSINSALENYLNKLNFTNLSKIRVSNKVFFTFVAVIVLFISYLSIPHTHNKEKIQAELKNQLLKKFGLNFNISKNLNYNFFPRPHFLIIKSTILDGKKKISEVKNLKIYVSLDNLFSLENMEIKDVVLENANFYLDKKNYDFFINLLDNNFLESIFKIKDSIIFFQDSEREVLFINKIKNMKYYYDFNNFKNILYSNNEVFNIPYSYEIVNNKIEKKIFTKINLNFLKLQIENELNYTNDIKKGLTNFIYHKNKSTATYELNDNSFIFNFFDKLKNPSFSYDGKINFVPFYSNFEGKADKINLNNLFNSNDLLALFLKTQILNNNNLNINLSINANKINFSQSFKDIYLNSKIQEGFIDIDNTKFSWNNYVNFEISDSLIYSNENQLILDGKLIAQIEEPIEIYKFLLTPKNYRTEIKKIEFNFNYNFDHKLLNLKNVKIDDQINQNVNNVLQNLIFKDDKLQNKVYFKNIINKAIKSYSG